MPAGPTEVLVIADKNSNPTFVASDLLSQAEHGTDSQVALVTDDESLSESVAREVEQQLSSLPRANLARETLKNSFTIITQNLEQAVGFSNQYAPEHLILAIENWEKYISQIQNAGSVFCGPFTPESAGDYASGTNHVLPTSGFARSIGGLSVESFGKFVTFQEISAEGLKNLGPAVAALAEREQLKAHARAVSIRLNDILK